jgi:tRNA A37 methylthiotransferase MiaB
MIEKSRRVYLESYGCQMNSYDSRAILDRLRAAGYESVAKPEDAGLLLLNTCAVRDHAETRVLGRIGQLQRFKLIDPSVRLGVAGCMAQRLGTELPRRRKAVDFVVGTDAYERASSTSRATARPSIAPVRNSIRSTTRISSRSPKAAITAAPSASCRRRGACCGPRRRRRSWPRRAPSWRAGESSSRSWDRT